MKKFLALALVFIMALSMASVAFAYTPGEKIGLTTLENATSNAAKREWKISSDFTSADKDYCGASMIDSIEIDKDGKVWLTIKESLTSITDRNISGEVKLTAKTLKEADGKTAQTKIIKVAGPVANIVDYIGGASKVKDADDIDNYMKINHVMVAEEAGYVKFNEGSILSGVVRVEKDEKAQVYKADIDDDTRNAIDTYLGENYVAIVEEYSFAGTGFKNKVAFTYEAYAEDPHYFYQWDGKKFIDLEAEFNYDEEVAAYEFTATAKGVIIVTDVEIVLAADDTTSKNPDTGAADVPSMGGVLAVVSLLAVGAIALKK